MNEKKEKTRPNRPLHWQADFSMCGENTRLWVVARRQLDTHMVEVEENSTLLSTIKSQNGSLELLTV